MDPRIRVTPQVRGYAKAPGHERPTETCADCHVAHETDSFVLAICSNLISRKLSSTRLTAYQAQALLDSDQAV